MSKIEAKINKMLNDNNKTSNAQGIRLASGNNNKIIVRNNKMYFGGTTSANIGSRILQCSEQDKLETWIGIKKHERFY